MYIFQCRLCKKLFREATGIFPLFMAEADISVADNGTWRFTTPIVVTETTEPHAVERIHCPRCKKVTRFDLKILCDISHRILDDVQDLTIVNVYGIQVHVDRRLMNTDQVRNLLKEVVK